MYSFMKILHSGEHSKQFGVSRFLTPREHVFGMRKRLTPLMNLSMASGGLSPSPSSGQYREDV